MPQKLFQIAIFNEHNLSTPGSYNELDAIFSVWKKVVTTGQSVSQSEGKAITNNCTTAPFFRKAALIESESEPPVVIHVDVGLNITYPQQQSHIIVSIR